MQHYQPDPDHTPDGYDTGAECDGPLEEHPLWERDNVTLRSLGIDIGSAGTQIIFSRLHLRRQSTDLSSRYLVVARETLFESPVSLTPYESETLIDARALGEIVDEAYHGARMDPGMIDTGVVILTGEALRRENAKRIATILSEKGGELVCATAGHHMEATLAAYGSGAVRSSFDRGERLLNVDIGGGTTKLSIIEKGKILATAALHIGSRLLATDSSCRLARLDPAGRAHASRAGLSLEVGETVTQSDFQAVAASMANDLVSALTTNTLSVDIANLYLTDPIEYLQNINAVIFSGGVAEFVYRREEHDFGDLGKLLGHAIRKKLDDGELPWPLLTDSRGIRSTVLGCSEFAAQLSGNTCYISNPDALLPRRNLNVLRPNFEFNDAFSATALADTIRRHMTMFEADQLDERLVLAFQWKGPPRYQRLRQLAEGIAMAIEERVTRAHPIYIVLDADIALTLGTILRRDLNIASEVMVLDGLALWDFDSIDIGKVRVPSMTVPVTIKSMIFSDVTGGPRPREIIHHAPATELTSGD